jgi:hypothetical protein
MESKLIYRAHAVQRMFERKITAKLARQALQTGETIEDYSDEMTHPSRLILDWQGKRPIHMVVSENAGQAVVITAYVPQPDLWTKNFKKRKNF